MNANTAAWQASADLAAKPSRHAFRKPQSLRQIGQPAEWIEPLRSRDDALAEAHDIAERNAFGVGVAFEYRGKWYASDFRPGTMDMITIDEVVTIEVGKRAGAER